jgi:hypothetical protein
MAKILLDTGTVEIDLGGSVQFELEIFGTYTLFHSGYQACISKTRTGEKDAEGRELVDLVAFEKERDLWLDGVIAHVREITGGVVLNKTQAFGLYHSLQELSQKKTGWRVLSDATPSLAGSTEST